MSLILVTTRDGGVTWVTLNRPESRNALSKQLNEDLIALSQQLTQDENVRVIVLTGAGDKAFSAGADLKERQGIAAADLGPHVDAISQAIATWADLPKVTIAAINGAALGGGLELALACDIRLASRAATFGLPEVHLGIIPGAGGTQRLPRLVGVAAAKELILSGSPVDAARALGLGLVSEVVESDELVSTASRWASEIAQCAPISLAMAKSAIDRGTQVSLDEGLRIERASYNITQATEDRNEGLRAFAEKRAPRFLGR